MGNLDLYEKVRAVPEKAKKEIKGGRLSGMTDINPMWRIKTLTENFGVCGIGWKIEIVSKWLDVGTNDEITANIQINLYIKDSETNKWSEPIVGLGGSKFVAKESTKLYTDDEAYKKAYTDAISVACKQLGVGADVYWEKDKTKYDGVGNKQTTKQPEKAKSEAVKNIENLLKHTDLTMEQVSYLIRGKSIDELDDRQYNWLLDVLDKHTIEQ